MEHARTTAGPGEGSLVETHLPLVHYAVAEVARRVPNHVRREDLTAAGMCGLVQAAHSWDPARGIPFDRYAGNRIQGAILDELRGIDWASRSVRARSRHLRAAEESLTGVLGRQPTTHEIAEHLQVAEREVAQTVADVHQAVVLNYEGLAAIDTESRLPTDTHTPEAILVEREEVGLLRDAIAVLPDRLRRVVVGYFFEELPMRDLAEELGVTESRISQMRAEALVLLKGGLDAQLAPQAAAPAADTPATRGARRRAAYYAEIAAHRTYKARIAVAGYAVPTVDAAAAG